MDPFHVVQLAGDALDRDVATWVEEARRTYILDCTKAEELWQAHCGGSPAQKPPFCPRQHVLEPFRITLKTCSRDDICLNQL